MAGVAQIIPNRRNTQKSNCPHSQRVLEIRSITLLLCAFCAFLRLKNPFNQRNPRLMNYLPSLMFLRLKNPRNLRNLRLINDLRSTKVYVRKNKLFMQNKANFQKSQMNVTNYITANYENMTLGGHGKNKPNSKPNKPNSPAPKPRLPLMEQDCYG